MPKKALFCLVLAAAAATYTVSTAATLAEACPSGNVTQVRSFKIKPNSSRAQFDAAVELQRAWYKANDGYGDPYVDSSTGLTYLESINSWTASPDTVITTRNGVKPVPASARNAAYYEFVTAINNSAELTFEALSCLASFTHPSPPISMDSKATVGPDQSAPQNGDDGKPGAKDGNGGNGG